MVVLGGFDYWWAASSVLRPSDGIIEESGGMMGLFLTKEIRDRLGKLHFQRFRLLKTPWFSVYVHRIFASDEDRHMHDHPFSFFSLILSGSYTETVAVSPNWGTPERQTHKKWDLVRRNYSDAHKLTVESGPVVTLVLAFKFQPNWGYQTEHGWIDHWLYRQRKRAGLLK